MSTEYNYDVMWEKVYGDIQRYGPVEKHLRRIYSKILSEIQYKSVLDVGCGTGLNFPLLLEDKVVKEVAGVDISSKAIVLAKERYSGEFRVLDIQEGHLESKYDLVFCSLVLEHLPKDVEAIKNLYEMTGRYLLVGTMAGNYERYKPWEKVVGHVRNYSPDELEAELERTGFTIRKCIKWGFPFYSPLTRLLQNINPNMGVGEYSTTLKIGTTLLYYVYFLNSFKRGDVLVILAEV